MACLVEAIDACGGLSGFAELIIDRGCSQRIFHLPIAILLINANTAFGNIGAHRMCHLQFAVGDALSAIRKSPIPDFNFIADLLPIQRRSSSLA
jgi:hypothetical protein